MNYRRRWTSKKTLYNDIWFASKGEADYAKKLDDNNIPYEIQRVFKIPDLNGELKWTYTTDFVVWLNVIEVKGYIDPIEKYKYAFMKYFLEQQGYKFHIVYTKEKKHKRTGKILRKELDISFLL